MKCYIATGGRGAIAGDLTIAVVLFPSPIESEFLSTLSPWLNQELWRKVNEEIYNLRDCWQAETFSLPVWLLDVQDLRICLRERLEPIVSRLSLPYTELPEIVVANKVVPPIRGYPYRLETELTAERVIARHISFLHFKTQIANKADLYPQYGFNKNWGYGTDEHYLTLLKEGPVRNVHRIPALLWIAPWLLRQLEAGNEAIRPYGKLLMKGQPGWWKDYHPNTPFQKRIRRQSEQFRLQCVLHEFYGHLEEQFVPKPEAWERWIEDTRPPSIY